MCSFENVDYSNTIKKILDIEENGIKEDLKINDLWNNYFKSLAESSEQVVIVDRYCIKKWLNPGWKCNKCKNF